MKSRFSLLSFTLITVVWLSISYSTVSYSYDDDNKKTLSHQFRQTTLANVSSPSEKVITPEKNTTAGYFKTLGHNYKNPNFRQSLQNKNNNSSSNRLLAKKYLSTLGHTFSNGSNNVQLQGKRLNNSNDDNSSSGFLENEELLLITQVDNQLLDTVFGYKSGNGALIGLDNLFAMIDFPISINLENRTASGWFINESQTFELSIPADETTPGSVTISGKIYYIPRSQVSVKDDDIYLHSDFLSKIFDIGFNINFKDLLLLITPNQLLPLQERLLRRSRLGKLTIGKIQPPQLPFRNTPYTAFSVPLIDVQASYSATKDNNSASYSMLGMGDLSYMTGRYYLSGRNDDLTNNFRVSLERESIDNDLLGPLNASRVTLGDISPAKIPLISSAVQEVGFQLTNRDLGAVSHFNTTSFVGDSLPNWDIELYHNNILLETVTVDDTGRYEFLDLDLFFGDNIFKMVFYGPQGQKSERIESVPVTTNSILERKLTYNVSVTKQDSSLFNNNTDNPLIDSYRTALAIEQSIDNETSIQSGFTSYQFRNGERHNFVPVNLNYFLPIAKFNLGYVKDLNAGGSAIFSAKSRFRNQTIDLNFKQFDQDFNTDSSFTTSTKNTFGLRFSGPLYNGNGTAVNYSLNASGSKSYESVDTTSFNAFIGAYTNRASITNNLTYFDVSVGNGSGFETLDGIAQFTKTFNSMRWRNQIGYKVIPDAELTSASTSLFWTMSPTLSSEFGINYNKASTQATYALNWDTEHAIVSANFSVSDNENYQAFLSYRFSFGQDPTSKKITVARDRIAATGGISARVFEDMNLDGFYNEGEPLIEGAKLVGVHSRKNAYSKDSGIALLTGLPTNQITDIKLDTNSLENPFWVPVKEGFSFLPRPGAVETYDIPIVTAGEIEGTVMLVKDKGGLLPARYATLQVLDSDGNVLQETDTEYDGFYLFSAVTPGTYTVRISPLYLKNKDLKQQSLKPKKVTIFGDGTVIRGLDFDLYSTKNITTPINTASSYIMDLGQFESPFNRQLTYRLLVKKYPVLRDLAVTFNEDSSNKLFIGPFKNNNTYTQLCQKIASKGLNCDISSSLN